MKLGDDLSLRRVLRLGVPGRAAPRAVGHITFLNGLCLIAAGLTFGTIVLRVATGGVGTAESAAYAFLSGIVPPIGVLWLNASGRHTAAALGFAAFVLISTAGAVLLFGPGTGMHYYYLPVSVLTFMLFPPDRRRTALLLAGAYAAAFLAFCVFFAEIPSPWPTAQVRRDFQINLSLIVFATALTAYFAQRATATTREALRAVRARTDALLREVLPGEFVARLREGAEVVGRRYDRASVVVCDIAGFTRLAEEEAAEELVRVLNTTFGAFDQLCRDLGADKIKTVGDAYVAGVGLSRSRATPAQTAVELALRMRTAVERSRLCQVRGIRVRIGVGTGAVIAGVVGTSKLAYDVWGEAVDGAFAMEQHAEPGEVVVDAATWAAVEPDARQGVRAAQATARAD